MGMGMTTTSTTVTISGAITTNVPIPSTGQTLTYITTIGNGAVQTIRTIAASTICYVMAVMAGDNMFVSLYDSAGTSIILHQQTTNPHCIVNVPIYKLTAGEFLKAQGDNAKKYTIAIIEVAA